MNMTFYHEGYDAFQQGIHECPYKPATAGHVYWWRGYDEARRQQEASA